LEIFKNFPFFGSGLETFAFSYYQYRPAEHNLLSEWDFLYNKAHNEFVNYLSTTGSLGFSTYILLIISTSIWLLRYMWVEKSLLYKFFAVSALASYAGYHVQNFFGFSVVTIALLFFLLPAFLFITSKSFRETRLEFRFLKKGFFAILVKGGVFILGVTLFLGTLNMWLADYFYNRGVSFVDAQESHKNLKIASQLRPDEPLYKAALGMTAIVLAETGPRNERNSKISEAFDYLNKASEISPNNINIWTLRFESIYGLTNIDERYLSQAIKTTEILAELAPTDARIHYNLATTYVAANDLKKAQSQLEKVVDLRFIYKDAWDLLFEVDKELKDEKALKKHMEEYKVAFPKNKI
jgi:tetratricopeptide (TPR) repeat protein